MSPFLEWLEIMSSANKLVEIRRIGTEFAYTERREHSLNLWVLKDIFKVAGDSTDKNSKAKSAKIKKIFFCGDRGVPIKGVLVFLLQSSCYISYNDFK